MCDKLRGRMLDEYNYRFRTISKGFENMKHYYD